MLYIKTLTVSSYDYQSATLSWEYTEPVINPAGIHLEIYRSETPEPVTMYSGINFDVSPTAYSYVDTTISGINSYQFHTWYYRIKVVETDTPANHFWSAPAHLSVTPDLQAKTMLRQKTVGLKMFGRDIKILKKRVAQGERCSCWDNVLQRSLSDNCPYCHGTGISTTGGYYDPIEVKAAINYTPTRNDITPFGVWQQNEALMDILAYPVMSPDDLVITETNQRYKVRQVAPFYKANALISQRCAITLQEKSNEIYNIKI